MQRLYRTFETAFGRFTFAEEAGRITGLLFGTAEITPAASTCLLEEAEDQLRAYFAGKLRTFSLPIRLSGTPFQQLCWESLGRIPYGETKTYGQLAGEIGHPAAVRAVGMAAHRNPLPILIPCHRLLGAGGRLTGYAGGIALKEKLLRLEKETLCTLRDACHEDTK